VFAIFMTWVSETKEALIFCCLFPGCENVQWAFIEVRLPGIRLTATAVPWDNSASELYLAVHWAAQRHNQKSDGSDERLLDWH
jgi:hypothetical protein